MQTRARRWGGLLLASALFVTACSPGGGPPDQGGGEGAAEPQQGGDLVMVRAAEPTGFVPTNVTDNASIWTLQNIFDTLVDTSADGSEVVPGLATEWTQSDDGLTWTFTLRTGVEFSDGTPLTAADVKFSLDRASQPERPYASLISAIESVKAPDDSTVVIETNQVWAPLASDLALFANSIVPEDFGGVSEEEFAENPVGTGPFVLENWTRGQTLELTKNPNYWKENRPYLDSVTFNLVSDPNTRARQLEGGQADINEFPPYSSLEGLESTPNVEVARFPSSRLDYIAMNNGEGPLADVNVRRAINHAIDREAIVNASTFGNADPAGSFLSPVLWAHDESIEVPEVDIDMAEEMLSESDYPEGFDTSITIASGNSESSAIAQIVQESLSELDIVVEIETLDQTAFDTARPNYNYDMFLYYVTTDIMDPHQLITFVTDDRIDANFEDEQLTEWATQGAQATDQNERMDLYADIQQRVSDQAIIAPLYYSDSVFAVADDVQGFEVSTTGSYSLAETWMSE